jgi:hypothetical protein
VSAQTEPDIVAHPDARPTTYRDVTARRDRHGNRQDDTRVAPPAAARRGAPSVNRSQPEREDPEILDPAGSAEERPADRQEPAGAIDPKALEADETGHDEEREP